MTSSGRLPADVWTGAVVGATLCGNSKASWKPAGKTGWHAGDGSGTLLTGATMRYKGMNLENVKQGNSSAIIVRHRIYQGAGEMAGRVSHLRISVGEEIGDEKISQAAGPPDGDGPAALLLRQQ